MRLLEFKSDGDIGLTENLLISDIPQYAILSHTWGPNTEEVTFKDMTDGTGECKPGYRKIRFCGEQARRDGLQFFWVDTCCIDKSDSTELSEAINSMFRWYQNSAKCYVYLADVSTPTADGDMEPRQASWETVLHNSRWFTRGWTLQEFVAPDSVEFFSKEGRLLGNKQAQPLGRFVSDITGIPAKALHGRHIFNFSVAERLSWHQGRQTTRAEDMAYSLLGIGTGTGHEDFSVGFSLSSVLDIEGFVAREEELEEMHKALSGDGSRRVIVLHGLGGMGKTQLSVAYAKRHKYSYSAVFWLNIKDDDSLRQSFAQVAKQILREHPSASRLDRASKGEDSNKVVDAVKAWLSLPGNTRWLLIYDNYDNPKLPGTTDAAAVDIQNFLPESYQGSIIITTRSSRVGIGHTIRITKLGDVHDSLNILSKMSRREGLLDDPNAVKLAKELDGFPLALATAGAYLRQVSMNFSDYLRLYKASWSKLQKTSPGLASYEDRTLYSTWQISFDRVREQNEHSAMLLRFWAYFDNQDIWFELLQHTGKKDPEWIRQITEDELTFHAAVRVLIDHGFVEPEASSQGQIESQGYSIHGCVHSWTIHVLNQTWDSDMEKLSLKLVARHVPNEDTAHIYLKGQRLLKHATRCTNLLINSGSKNEMAWAYYNLGMLYSNLGKLSEAEKMYEWALRGDETIYGPTHKSTLQTLHNLAIIYEEQGRLDEAEKMYQRALQGKEEVLGLDHTLTLNTVNNLGNVFKKQEKLDEAEKMYQQALQGYERASGPDGLKTLNTVNNLGLLYQIQGKLDEAEKMYQRALQGYERALGCNATAFHVPALNTLYNLGLLFAEQNDKIEARKWFLKAQAGCRNVYGKDHRECQDVEKRLAGLRIPAIEDREDNENSNESVSTDPTGRDLPAVSQSRSNQPSRWKGIAAVQA